MDKKTIQDILSQPFVLTDWQNLYTKSINQTLFGEDTKLRKVEEPIRKITKLYIKKLQTV